MEYCQVWDMNWYQIAVFMVWVVENCSMEMNLNINTDPPWQWEKSVTNNYLIELSMTNIQQQKMKRMF